MRTAFVGIVLFGLAGSAQASTLMRDTVYGYLEAPNAIPGTNLFNFSGSPASPASAVVGPGVEFSFTAPDPGGATFADFAASSVTIGIIGTGPIDSIHKLIYEFTDLDFDTGATIADVSISLSSFWGVTVGRNANSIRVEIPEQALPPNYMHTLVLKITPTSVVPEPATIGLSAFGALALVGLARSRRTR